MLSLFQDDGCKVLVASTAWSLGHSGSHEMTLGIGTSRFARLHRHVEVFASEGPAVPRDVIRLA